MRFADELNQAQNLIERGCIEEALRLLRSLSSANPSVGHIHYLIGQCYRIKNQIPEAISSLKNATDADQQQSDYWQALGIAYQLIEDFDSAVDALKRSLEVDPHNLSSINSLALTQKRMGELDKAVNNYELGAKLLVNQMVMDMKNNRSSPIYKHVDTKGKIWVGHAVNAGMKLAIQDECEGMAWPTADQAINEERTEEHGGMFWSSFMSNDNKDIRLYLPNFFNTIRENLKGHPLYATLIGNRGLVLDLLGRAEEANEHFIEAEEFS